MWVMLLTTRAAFLFFSSFFLEDQGAPACAWGQHGNHCWQCVRCVRACICVHVCVRMRACVYVFDSMRVRSVALPCMCMRLLGHARVHCPTCIRGSCVSLTLYLSSSTCFSSFSSIRCSGTRTCSAGVGGSAHIMWWSGG